MFDLPTKMLWTKRIDVRCVRADRRSITDIQCCRDREVLLRHIWSISDSLRPCKRRAQSLFSLSQEPHRCGVRIGWKIHSIFCRENCRSWLVPPLFTFQYFGFGTNKLRGMSDAPAKSMTPRWMKPLSSMMSLFMRREPTVSLTTAYIVRQLGKRCAFLNWASEVYRERGQSVRSRNGEQQGLQNDTSPWHVCHHWVIVCAFVFREFLDLLSILQRV